jgi:hypothetical protein
MPAAGIDASGTAQLGGDAAKPAGDATAQADAAELEKTGDSWWQQAGAWAGSAAGAVAGGAQTGLDAVQSAAAGSKDAIIAGATSAWGSAGAGAGAAMQGTTSAAACAMAQSQNLFCKTSGMCEVKEIVCAEDTQTASK